GIKNIILVGGPVVIKAEVKTELEAAGYNVIRLWGMERTGTSVAVAKHFWPEGSDCAVLVSDTKDSDADSRRQLAASNLAASMGCTFIPVPAETLPSDVLATLSELEVRNVIFIGAIPAGVREKLGEFRLRELTGSEKELEEAVENDIINKTRLEGTKPKLVIVATPDWKAAVGIGTHPHHRSVVRMIHNVSSLADVLAFIQKYNITDVRVVGIPSLADQIASSLEESGINVTKISGEKAHEIARKTHSKIRSELEERRLEHERLKLNFKLRIRTYLENHLNDTINKLDRIDAELAERAESAEKQTVNDAIENARTKIAEIRSLLKSGDLDAARRLTAEIRFKADEKRFAFREKLGINVREDIDDEEKGIDDLEKDADSRLEGVRGRLGSIRGMCSDTTEIESIVARARELHSQAKEAMESGNFREAAGHLERSRKLVKIAGHTAEACDERGLPEVAGMVIQHHGIRTPIAVIKSPKEGETIGRNAVTVRVDAKNIRLEKPSANVVKGEAHFHVFLDDTEQRGPQREFIFRNVTAGEHTIRTELHVADHSLLEGSIADEIKINVTAAYSGS
ncbi:hypothetical protein HY501_02665, partial [Candidatus Woesearchaeota archaeon]|nr:hypothetical protein [Candidatus Woesearchaeota archaeon]